jgi:hypothetical protein
MKKLVVLSLFSLAFITFSCKKNKCHDCHYEKDGVEVEIGEKCGDDLENSEANGIVVDGVTYEVHCHEH